jgi:hypothetical protein
MNQMIGYMIKCNEKGCKIHVMGLGGTKGSEKNVGQQSPIEESRKDIGPSHQLEKLGFS